jgi:hypothetical protein
LLLLRLHDRLLLYYHLLLLLLLLLCGSLLQLCFRALAGLALLLQPTTQRLELILQLGLLAHASVKKKEGDGATEEREKYTETHVRGRAIRE